MHINWGRSLITIGVIVISSSLLGFLTWFGMDKIIQAKDAEINLLTNTSEDLSRLYSKKLADNKTEEEANSSAITNYYQSSESDNSTPVSQSQIYFFYSPSCGACIIQKPIVLELQSEGVPFVFCNVVAHPEYISKYKITAVPTFILNGHRRTAVLSKAELLSFWNTYK